LLVGIKVDTSALEIMSIYFGDIWRAQLPIWWPE
jgi:hypothetical protein